MLREKLNLLGVLREEPILIVERARPSRMRQFARDAQSAIQCGELRCTHPDATPVEVVVFERRHVRQREALSVQAPIRLPVFLVQRGVNLVAPEQNTLRDERLQERTASHEPGAEIRRCVVAGRINRPSSSGGTEPHLS